MGAATSCAGCRRPARKRPGGGEASAETLPPETLAILEDQHNHRIDRLKAQAGYNAKIIDSAYESLAQASEPPALFVRRGGEMGRVERSKLKGLAKPFTQSSTKATGRWSATSTQLASARTPINTMNFRLEKVFGHQGPGEISHQKQRRRNLRLSQRATIAEKDLLASWHGPKAAPRKNPPRRAARGKAAIVESLTRGPRLLRKRFCGRLKPCQWVRFRRADPLRRQRRIGFGFASVFIGAPETRSLQN